MKYPQVENPTPLPTVGMIDTETMLNVSIPLGPQMPAVFWDSGDGIDAIERAAAIRKVCGIGKIDDQINPLAGFEELLSESDGAYYGDDGKGTSPVPKKRGKLTAKPKRAPIGVREVNSSRTLATVNDETKTSNRAWEMAVYFAETEIKAWLKDQGYETKAAGGSNGPATGASEALNRYWTRGKGLARWANTATPFRSLVAALKAEGIPARMRNGLAAKYYKTVKGTWPGKRGGKKS